MFGVCRSCLSIESLSQTLKVKCRNIFKELNIERVSIYLSLYNTSVKLHICKYLIIL